MLKLIFTLTLHGLLASALFACSTASSNQTAQPVKADQPNQEEQPAKKAQPIKEDQATQTVQATQIDQPTQTVQATQTDQSTQTVQTVKATPKDQPIQIGQATQIKQTVKTVQTDEINDQLVPYIAKYEAVTKVGWFDISIDATRTLEKVDDHWKMSFVANSSVADLHEISEFNITNQQILPINYHYKTNEFHTKKIRNIEFNRTEKKAWLPYKQTWANYELTDEIQDQLTYQEQVRIDLMNGKTLLSYPVAYKARLKDHTFEVMGETIIQTKQGPIAAIQIKQIKTKGKESTHIWLAKDYDYIILKLQTTSSKGTKQTLSLKYAKIGDKELTGL